MTKGHRPMTLCVHAGSRNEFSAGAVATPVFTASAYAIGAGSEGPRYPRYLNTPNQLAAAEKMAALEHGEAGLITASGMASVTSVLLGLLSPGDHAVIQSDIYGGTYHFVESDLTRLGIGVTLVKGRAVADFEAAIRPESRLLYCETPSNPLLKVVDLAGVAKLARAHNLVSVVDNTFASPVNQTPIDLGLDVVLHSGTKYLGGHSDLLCGVIVTREELMARLAHTVVNMGGVLGAFELSQLERSLKTLILRVRQQNMNAQAVAEFLAGHPEVETVNYPGLPDNPDHALARSQMSGFGGMLSFAVRGDHPKARGVVDRLGLFTHAVSLGGVESLVCFPCLTSHAKMSAADRAAMGIGDNLIRVSVGIEDPEDLIADLKQALEG